MYTMAGRYIRDVSYPGSLRDRYLPITVSYTGYPHWAFPANDRTAKRDHCMHFYNPQIDLVEFHSYPDEQNAAEIIANIIHQVFDSKSMLLTIKLKLWCSTVPPAY